MADVAGSRLYLIRLACGDGVRTAEPMRAFAERVKAQTGQTYDPTTISLLERMQQKWRLDDVEAFAAVDPQQRGKAWLAFGEDQKPGRPAGAPPIGTFHPDPRPKLIPDPRKEATSKPAKRGGKRA